MRISQLLPVIACLAGGPAMAEVIDFGNDSSRWANDGECDDPRFTGPGMTSTTLLDSDIRRDATDCRTAYKAGRLFLVDAAPKPVTSGGVNFGDDAGQWAHDGECDDPRFAGPGMTSTTLLSADVLHDATDCRSAYQVGRLVLRGVMADGTIDFGDNSSEWAFDNECDDMRFAGSGMTTTPLLFDDIMADANDCRSAFEAGRLSLAGQ